MVEVIQCLLQCHPMILYKIFLLSLSPLALSAFHVGDIFKCLVFFGCSLIFKSRTRSLCVPGCFYLRVGFIKIDGSILCIPWKERIYSLGSFNYYREEFSSLFFWKHLRMVWSERTRVFHFSLHRFSLNLSMRCPVLIIFCAEKSGAIFLESKSCLSPGLKIEKLLPSYHVWSQDLTIFFHYTYKTYNQCTCFQHCVTPTFYALHFSVLIFSWVWRGSNHSSIWFRFSHVLVKFEISCLLFCHFVPEA